MEAAIYGDDNSVAYDCLIHNKLLAKLANVSVPPSSTSLLLRWA
jgi:hypothetical protein